MNLNTIGIAHALLEHHVQPGDLCVDATAGRGRDTVLLCRLTGPRGRVIALDIQPEALEQTRELLRQQNAAAELHLDNHANLRRYAEPDSVSCVVFNFGRLPGGDPTVFTRAESSVAAIGAGLELLREGGLMSLSLYYGKENGYDERDAILNYLASIDEKRYTVLSGTWLNRRHDPPLPVAVWKRSG